MGGRKITITVTEAQLAALEEMAAERGHCRASEAVRCIALAAAWHRLRPEDSDARTVEVRVDNWRELSEYVRQKKLGSVAVFATFAMEAYMQRNPTTQARKALKRADLGSDGKSIGNSGSGASTGLCCSARGAFQSSADAPATRNCADFGSDVKTRGEGGSDAPAGFRSAAEGGF